MRVLIADDDRIQLEILRNVISQWDYEVVTASDGLAAWTILNQDDPPPLAVLDWMMPGMQGVDLCRRIRDHQDTSYTYILILSALQEIDNMVEAIDAGADDFIAKPFHYQELRVRLRSGRRLVELHHELNHRATRDPLTGIFNRARILDALSHELERSQRNRQPVGLIMLDVDHFKQINDTHGHTVGDDVLIEICQRLGQSLRGFDSLGRFGGEEFLFVLPECDLQEAETVAERIRQTIASRPIATADGDINVSVSCGVSSYPGCGHRINQLLVAADQALYLAKRNGRNRVESAGALDAMSVTST